MRTRRPAVPVTLQTPSPEDQVAGVAARFEYRDALLPATVRGVAKRGDRGLTITSLEIIPDDGDIGGHLLRQLRVGNILAQVRAAVPPPTEDPHLVRVDEATRSCECGHRRGGWPAITDDHLRRVATTYLEETAPDADPGALARMARHFGRPEGTVRTWVKRARSDGWLGPGAKGRPGCEPGPRLLSAMRLEAAK